jgi:hypothetical protein
VAPDHYRSAADQVLEKRGCAQWPLANLWFRLAGISTLSPCPRTRPIAVTSLARHASVSCARLLAQDRIDMVREAERIRVKGGRPQRLRSKGWHWYDWAAYTMLWSVIKL